jgi:hypothetical protein
MPLEYKRDLTVRDWEAVGDLPEKQQNLEYIARCYGLTLDQVRDLSISEMMKCANEVVTRNGLA